MSAAACLARIEGLRVEFHTERGVVSAVEDVSFSIPAGETTALVGESGCGKSVTALSLARLLPEPPARYASGSVFIEGDDVLRMTPRALRDLRGQRVAYVFQEPATALNPTMTVGHQIAEMVATHRPEADAWAAAVAMLERVRVPDAARRATAYPHELSGGLRQRAMIAMALVCRPKLLVADEPTTALDVTTQARILELMNELRGEFGMAVLLITHNLGIVAGMATNVHVMYAGRIVESGRVGDVLGKPRHPYTHALLQAVPRLRAAVWNADGRVEGIAGSVPQFPQRLPGCKFAPRCPRAQARCVESEPPLGGGGQPSACRVRCWFPMDCAITGARQNHE
jgi:peptide/nickel transport system ATP-binding protein